MHAAIGSEELDPDQVVLSTGAVFSMPPIEGIEHAVNGADVIARKIPVPEGL